jgi:hypothetical protein
VRRVAGSTSTPAACYHVMHKSEQAIGASDTGSAEIRASKYAATSDGRREMYQGAINTVLAMFDACRGTPPTDETSLICDEREDWDPRDLTIA